MKKQVDAQRLIKRCQIRVVYIAPDEILSWFDLAQHDETPPQRWGYDLPDDYILKDVRYDFTRAAFAFYILSAEFDSVALGAEIPSYQGTMHKTAEFLTE